MKVLAWILIAIFIIIVLLTIYFGVNSKGREKFVAAIYILPLIYNVFIGLIFVFTIPGPFLGGNSQAKCFVNLGIAGIGLLICCYIGWSRISRSRPWLHLLYVSALTSIPLLTYQLDTSTPEAVSSLACSVCYFGLIRYRDKKYNFITFALIASGIAGSLMTKLSACVICFTMTLLMFIATAIKSRSIKKALPREFVMTLPIYALALIFSPSLDYITYNSYLQINQSYRYTPILLVFEVMWCVPMLYVFPSVRRHANNQSLPIVSGWMAVIGWFCYELKKGYSASLLTWYFGCYMGMHFIPFEGVFAMSLVYIFRSLLTDNGFDPENDVTTIKGPFKIFCLKLIYNHIIYAIALSCCFIIFYGSYPYFLMHFQL